MRGDFGFLAGVALVILAFSLPGMIEKAITPDLNTVTIHKTQDRLPVACQEGAQ